jgi:hypothetical protein
VTSTGFWVAANSGTTWRSRSTVSGANSGISMPSSSARSAMISLAPPEAVTNPKRLPGSGPVAASSPAVMMRSSRQSTRITPFCLNTASTTASSPTREPVWALATRAPVWLRPTLIATIGLPAASASRASAMNSAGWRTDSMNSAMTLVASSSMR